MQKFSKQEVSRREGGHCGHGTVRSQRSQTLSCVLKKCFNKSPGLLCFSIKTATPAVFNQEQGTRNKEPSSPLDAADKLRLTNIIAI